MNKKGFTLIELLIVVAIISILAGIVLVGLRPSLTTARDARRVAEIKQIQTGLQLYYNRYGNYPTALTDITGSGIGVDSIPLTDPSNVNYGYTKDTPAGGYTLGTMFESTPGQSTKNQVTSGSAAGSPSIDCANSLAYCVSF